MSLKITVKVPGIDRMRKAIENNPALSRSIANAWSTIFRSFTRQRFVKFSRGGGDWPPLKPATIKRRRGGGDGAAILRDTGALLASIQPEGAGGLLQTTPRPLGFTAFLGGGGSYKSGPTLAEVATWQQTGAGHLPVREILVQPDQGTIDRMGVVGKQIIVKTLNEGK